MKQPRILARIAICIVSSKARDAFSIAQSHFGSKSVSVTSFLFSQFLLKSSILKPTWKKENIEKNKAKGYPTPVNNEGRGFLGTLIVFP